MGSPMDPLKKFLVKGLCFCVPLEQFTGNSCISGIIQVNLRVKGKSGTHLIPVQPPWFLSINKTCVFVHTQILEICSCLDSEFGDDLTRAVHSIQNYVWTMLSDTRSNVLGDPLGTQELVSNESPLVCQSDFLCGKGRVSLDSIYEL